MLKKTRYISDDVTYRIRIFGVYSIVLYNITSIYKLIPLLFPCYVIRQSAQNVCANPLLTSYF